MGLRGLSGHIEPKIRAASGAEVVGNKESPVQKQGGNCTGFFVRVLCKSQQAVIVPVGSTVDNHLGTVGGVFYCCAEKLNGGSIAFLGEAAANKPNHISKGIVEGAILKEGGDR